MEKLKISKQTCYKHSSAESSHLEVIQSGLNPKGLSRKPKLTASQNLHSITLEDS